jgi:hypothetical protein
LSSEVLGRKLLSRPKHSRNEAVVPYEEEEHLSCFINIDTILKAASPLEQQLQCDFVTADLDSNSHLNISMNCNILSHYK